jgi:hypothetical protein
MPAQTSDRFVHATLVSELIDFHAQQTLAAKAETAALLQESVRNAGIAYTATDLAEDGAADLTDALRAMKNGKFGVAEGLISATLDALNALRAELACSKVTK